MPRRKTAARYAALPMLSRRVQLAIVAALLLLYVVMAVTASTSESNTFDEALHLTTGYLYWAHPEMAKWPVGVFDQAWAGLPLLADHLQVVPVPPHPQRQMGEWDTAYDFFYLMGNDPDRMLLQGRLMMALLGAALGALVFWWSRRLFTVWGALVSLLLFVFCPAMLAHGALVTADMGAALWFVAATFTFWELSHRVSWTNLACSLLAFTCLVLVKMSFILILPVFLALLVVRLVSSQGVELPLLRKPPVQDRWGRLGAWAGLTAIHALVVLVLLWVFFDFKHENWNQEAIRTQVVASPDFTWTNPTDARVAIVDDLASLGILPAAFIENLSHHLAAADEGGGFLCGQVSTTGFWWFFPFAFLVKTPISTLLLLLAAAVALVLWRPRFATARVTLTQTPPVRPTWYELAPLIALAAVYCLATLGVRLDIGHRHILPLYPILYILAGANVYWLVQPGKLFRVLIGVLLFGLVVESWAVRPHYLAFFNAGVGGPDKGYKYLVDSSLDWGQDLPGLAAWQRATPEAVSGANVYLAYFGTASPDYYGIKAWRLPGHFGSDAADPATLGPGLYCLSATLLQNDRFDPANEPFYERLGGDWVRWNDPVTRAQLIQEKGGDYGAKVEGILRELQFERLCGYLRNRTPERQIGYSILVYRVTADDLQAALAPVGQPTFR